MRFKAHWLFLLVVAIVVSVLIGAQALQARGGRGGSQVTTTGAQPQGQPGIQMTLNPIDESVSPTLLDHPPELSTARRAAREAELQRRAALRRTRPVGDQVAASAAPEGALDNAPDPASAPKVAGNPFVVEVNSPLNPVGNGFGSANVNEPTVAQSGGFLAFTGNWYFSLAYTANPGPADFVYIDPYADIPDFCCDQDVVTDQARDLFLWSRLAGDRGRFTLSVSTDHFNSYCTYELNPSQFGFDGFYDQPLMQLSNNNVYISVNDFGSAFHNVIYRLSLDQLQDCGGVSLVGWDITDANGWGGLTAGATTTMYLGSHRGTNNSMRIFTQPENSTTIFRNDVAIAAFTFQNGNSVCGRNGTNPCGRSDSRIQAGWVRKGSNQTVGEIGFMWDAHEGGGFPFPYVETATFRQDTLAYTGRPYIAYSDAAIQYPGASPNARGDVGLTASLMGGVLDPDTGFYLADDYQGMWTFQTYLAVSTGSVTNWGDYVRNQPFLPCGGGWTTASHSLQNGVFTPLLSIVSRMRDRNCIVRQLNTP